MAWHLTGTKPFNFELMPNVILNGIGFLELIETERQNYFSVTIIGSDNDFAPTKRQAIIWTNTGLSLTGPLGKYFNEIYKIRPIFIVENPFENVIWKMLAILSRPQCVNTLGPRQNGHRFPDNSFKCIFFNENVWISIKITMKFIPKGPINNIPALVLIMAWPQSGDRPLSEPMMVCRTDTYMHHSASMS